MAISERKISKLLVGRLSAYSAETLKMIKDIIGVQFTMENADQIGIDDEDDQEEGVQSQMIFSCVGLGLVNIARITK